MWCLSSANVADQTRLRAEKEALEALLRPPSVGKAIQPSKLSEEDILNDIAEEERCMRATLQKGVSLPAEMGSRVNQIINELGPIVDTFADGVHKINQYRMAADDVASRVLATCAEKLTERELAGRKQALGSDEYNSPRRDLNSVLRGLSKSGTR